MQNACVAVVLTACQCLQTPKIANFPVKFPVCREIERRQVRSALRRQPPIRAVGQAPQEARECAGNPGCSRIRFCLWTPGSSILRWKSPKVSGLVREYSRFAETIGGDWFDHDCRRPCQEFEIQLAPPAKFGVTIPLGREVANIPHEATVPAARAPLRNSGGDLPCRRGGRWSQDDPLQPVQQSLLQVDQMAPFVYIVAVVG